MSLFDSSRAILGGKLVGRLPLRYIYLDEAGISGAPQVSIRIVAGIIVHPDAQYRAMQEQLYGIIQNVPLKFRDNFFLHAKDIMDSKNYGDDWPLSERIEFLARAMRIPRECGATVVYGMFRKMYPPHDKIIAGLTGLEIEHSNALWYCLAEADEYVRTYASADEIATVIYEDMKAKKKHLDGALDQLRAGKYAQIFETAQIIEYFPEIPVVHSVIYVERIIDGVLYADKRKSPFLQFADCCAYGLSRFFEKRPGGEQYYEALSGRKVAEIEPNIIDAVNGRACFFDHARAERKSFANPLRMF